MLYYLCMENFTHGYFTWIDVITSILHGVGEENEQEVQSLTLKLGGNEP